MPTAEGPGKRGWGASGPFFYLQNIMSHSSNCTDNAKSSCQKVLHLEARNGGQLIQCYTKIAQGLATACSKRKKPNTMSGADEPEKRRNVVHWADHCATNVCKCVARGCVTKASRGESTSGHCGYPDAANIITNSCKRFWNADTDLTANKRGGSML